VGRALKEGQIQFLRTINDESRSRRAEKSLVLGKARVMSYEDLQVARAKRAEKEADKAGKKKQRACALPKQSAGSANVVIELVDMASWGNNKGSWKNNTLASGCTDCDVVHIARRSASIVQLSSSP
jgi:hypothetical protein